MEPPDKTLEAYRAAVNQNAEVNASLEDTRLAFKMLYLYFGSAYINDLFVTGKTWTPRLRDEDRDWMVYWVKHQEFPPVAEPEGKKKREKRKVKE